MTFKETLQQGIPSTLPEPSVLAQDVSRAPIRKDILSPAEKKLAVRNALRYFPAAWHKELAKELAKKKANVPGFIVGGVMSMIGSNQGKSRLRYR